MKKFVAALVTTGALFAILAPAAALASNGHHGKPPAKGAAVVAGTICAYTAGKSVTISQSCGTSSDVTVSLNSHSRLNYEGKTSPAPAAVAGDAATAFLRWHKGTAVVKNLEFSETAFGYAHKQFPGTYVSSTGDCTSGTLVVMGQGKKGVAETFATDANTVYEANDTASTCSAVTASYVKNERVNVTGSELTNNTWYATLVNAHGVAGGKH